MFLLSSFLEARTDAAPHGFLRRFFYFIFYTVYMRFLVRRDSHPVYFLDPIFVYNGSCACTIFYHFTFAWRTVAGFCDTIFLYMRNMRRNAQRTSVNCRKQGELTQYSCRLYIYISIYIRSICLLYLEEISFYKIRHLH